MIEGLNLSADEHRGRIERLMNSKEYRELEKTLSNNNPRFRDLPNRYRVAAIYSFSLGVGDYLPGLSQYFYSRKIPSIEEFMTIDYIGMSANYIWPKWRETLLDVFSPTSTIYELIIGGSIGGGKTWVSNLCHFYNLYRVCSLRHPQLTLGVAPTTLLVLALFSTTMPKAQLAVMNGFVELMRACPKFKEVQSRSDFLDFQGTGITPWVEDGTEIYLPNNIMVMSGSRVSHALSFSMIGGSLDEAEFRISGLEDAVKTYDSIKERVRSRFMGSRFIFMTMMSSAKYSIGIMADYMKRIKPDDPHSKYIAYPIWEIKEKYPYERGHFYIMRGTQNHPHRLLDPLEKELADNGEYEVPENCKLVKVPEGEYRKSFEANISDSLKNLAGEQELGSEYLFSDTSRIEKPFLVPEAHIHMDLSETTPLIDKVPSSMFVNIPGGRRLARYPLAPRYLHYDLAEIAQAGITLLHKEYVIVNGQKVTVYVADLVASIFARDRINLDSLEQFIFDLVENCGVVLMGFSSDQYQSAQMRQKVEKRRLMYNGKKNRPQIISVERVSAPYDETSRLVSNNQWYCGSAPRFREQLRNMQKDESGKVFSHIRKDVADAASSATHNALMYIDDEPVYAFVETAYQAQKPGEIKTMDEENWREIV